MAKETKSRAPQREIIFNQHIGKDIPHYIIVMGETGAGKSTFVNKLLGRDTMVVGTGLSGCTHDVQVTNIRHEKSNRSFAVVDTPGFNDGSKGWPDSILLEIIAGWLKETHTKNPIAAVIYIHDISRIIHKSTFWTIKDICGQDSFSHIVIVTNKWDKPDTQLYVNTEEYLENNIWNPLISRGARIFRWSQTKPVDPVLDYIATTLRDPINELKIQNEMKTGKKRLNETSAGRHVGIRKTPWWHKFGFKFLLSPSK